MSKYPVRPEFQGFPESAPTLPYTDAGSPEMISSVRSMLDQGNAAFRVDESKLVMKKITVTGYQGAEIPAIMFVPVNPAENMPCILNCHGGAFYFGAAPTHLALSAHYAEALGCCVVLPLYRLAPEYTFPYGVEDCYATLLWIVGNAKELGIDTKRIAVLGDSAGGALAAAVTQMARDRKGPAICCQMLIYPVTDNSRTTVSSRKFIDTPFFNGMLNTVMWNYYLPEDNLLDNPYAAPARAGDLSGLPAAYVETAEFDCLHDEGVAYARRLKDCGVETILFETEKTFHGFDNFPTPYVVDSIQRRTAFFSRAFAV